MAKKSTMSLPRRSDGQIGKKAGRASLIRVFAVLALLAGVFAAAGPVAAYSLSILHAHRNEDSSSRKALISDGSGNLYGTTAHGGSSSAGTVFKIKSDGTGFQLLYSFMGGESDGAMPDASLILDSTGNLYGTTWWGGSSGEGTVFKVKKDGTGFQRLHSFSSGASDDGSYPAASLILDSSEISTERRTLEDHRARARSSKSRQTGPVSSFCTRSRVVRTTGRPLMSH